MKPFVDEVLFNFVAGKESFLNGFHADIVGGAPFTVFTFGHPFVDGLGFELFRSVDAIGGELLADLVGSAFLSSEHEVSGDGVPVFLGDDFSFLGISLKSSLSFGSLSFDFI